MHGEVSETDGARSVPHGVNAEALQDLEHATAAAETRRLVVARDHDDGNVHLAQAREAVKRLSHRAGSGSRRVEEIARVNDGVGLEGNGELNRFVPAVVDVALALIELPFR